MTASLILNMISDALNWTSASDLARLYGPTTLAYFDLAEITDWPLLRQNVSMTFVGSKVAMPSGTIGATNVIAADGSPYWQCEEADAKTSTGRKRWFYASMASGNPLSATKYIQIVDADGAAASATVRVYYWAYPPAITAGTDEILLPSSRALVIKTLLYMGTVVDHDPEASDRLNAEYDKAVAEMLAKAGLPRRFTGGKR